MPRKRVEKDTQETRPSQMKFGDLLQQYVGIQTSNTPTRVSGNGISISPALTEMEESAAKDTKKKSVRGSSYGRVVFEDDDTDLESSFKELSEMMPENDDYDSAFDDLIEDAFRDDEDVQFRNSLIAMGRKYAIKGMEEETESSEVNRSFVKQEQYIEMAIEELNRDAAAIQRDLEMLRMSRTRSYKALSDLASAKTSNITAKLGAIKQLTDIQKAKYDISMKLKRERDGSGGNDSGYAATQAVQKLLGIGRANLLGADEYELTTSIEEPGNADYDDGRPESAIQRTLDIPEAVTDGDKFIQYENDGVEYVLDVDRDTEHKQIYAINKNGDVVPDYPMPSNPDQLQFSVNEVIGEATDQLQRRYRLRYNGEDVGDHKEKESSSEN